MSAESFTQGERVLLKGTVRHIVTHHNGRTNVSVGIGGQSIPVWQDIVQFDGESPRTPSTDEQRFTVGDKVLVEGIVRAGRGVDGKVPVSIVYGQGIRKDAQVEPGTIIRQRAAEGEAILRR